jgi:hypothetical protein
MTGMMAFRMVFASKAYAALAAAIAAAFWTLFSWLDQLLFFEPVLAFYIPGDAAVGFVLSIITSVLLGIVVSMNVYVFRNSKVKLGASLFSGSTLSVVSSACAGCTSTGFFFVTTFGVAGIAATSIFAQYQIPLRLVGIALLVWAYYAVNKRLNQVCALKPE